MKLQIPKSVRLKTYLLSLTLISVIFLGTIVYVASNPGFTAPNVYLDDIPSEASYVVKTDGTYFWAVRYDGKIPAGMNGTDDDLFIQYTVDNCTANGGTVLVKAGTYSASVTLKDKVRLVIEEGATGITVNIDTGATCWLLDYNSGLITYYVNGVVSKALGSVQTATFIIDKSGSTYRAWYGANSTLAYSSTDASTVIQWAVDAVAFGDKIFVKNMGSVTLVTPILFTGTGTSAPSSIVFECETLLGTTFEPASGVNAFQFKNAAMVHFKNVRVALPSSNTVSAIVGLDDGATTKCSVIRSIFENIQVTGGDYVSSYYCIHLKNPMYSNFAGFNRFNVNGLGAIKLEQTDDTSGIEWGDMQFEGQMRIWLGRTNAVGIELLGLSAYKLINIHSNMYLMIDKHAEATGTTGLKMTYTVRPTFTNLQFENLATCIKIANSSNIIIHHISYLSATDGGTIVSVDANSRDIYLLDWNHVDVPSGKTVVVLSDANPTVAQPTVCDRWVFSGAGTKSVTKTSATIIKNWRGSPPAGYEDYKFISQSVSFANGGNFDVNMPHGLAYTPDKLNCMAVLVEDDTPDDAYGYLIEIRSTNATHVVVRYRVVSNLADANKLVCVYIRNA